MSPAAGAKKGVEHTTLEGDEARCLHCGRSQKIAYPVSIEILSAIGTAFNKEHRRCKPSPAGAARFKFTTPDEWFASWDTGTSSKTLWAAFTGDWFRVERRGVPHAPADFGRCHRMLQAFPEWRKKLAEKAGVLDERARGWHLLIENWPELERLYEEELPTGSAPKLYAFMRSLHDRIGVGS